MAVKLEWRGSRLMLGELMVAEVRDAGMMAGNFASWTMPGAMPVSVSTAGRFEQTNSKARTDCYEAVVKTLRAAGVEVE